jgi:FemAB-related protein (PEP-CTERM system-associated)
VSAIDTATTKPTVLTLDRQALASRLPALVDLVRRSEPHVPLSRHPAWLTILERGLGHQPHALVTTDDTGQTTGFLPLAYVRSMLFGRFLVSLPYLNYGGVIADDPASAALLVERAVELANRLQVKNLELRHVQPLEHPALPEASHGKVHMRLALPASPDLLWKAFKPEVRNQVRKGQKHELQIAWGGLDQLDAFYDVFARNMRDLGTPVFPRRLFAAILDTFPDQAELCVVRKDQTPIAAAILLHGWGVTEVPSASSLREFNSTCANMLMYWSLIERAIARGQAVFDFGRSSPDSGTYRFKVQWGATPLPATWQFHLRTGTLGTMRPDNPKYQRAIRIWQKLPLGVTRALGPWIVRGIP